MNETYIFLAILVAAITIFDVYIIKKKGKTASISAVIIRLSYKYPSIPFLLGFVCGHLFWRMVDIDVFGVIG